MKWSPCLGGSKAAYLASKYFLCHQLLQKWRFGISCWWASVPSVFVNGSRLSQTDLRSERSTFFKQGRPSYLDPQWTDGSCLPVLVQKSSRTVPTSSDQRRPSLLYAV